METEIREMRAMMAVMSRQLDQLAYDLARCGEHQKLNGARLDVLQQRIISHEAFIDEKLGLFAEQWQYREAEGSKDCSDVI